MARTNRLASPAIVAVAVLAALIVSGCGDPAQNANVKTGTWTVAVEDFAFPRRQPLGDPATLKLTIRNQDSRAIPQLAVTINGLRASVDQENAESRTRPIWIVNKAPGKDATPYSTLAGNTYDLGALPAGQSRKFELPLTPIRRGKYVVSYSIATNIFGGGIAKRADGSLAAGRREVAIDPTPHFDRTLFE